MNDGIRLTPGRRVLFLTRDLDLIRRQLGGELELRMEELSVEDLLDDINTDVMTPAWVCFDWRPEEIARNAYAGLLDGGERVFAPEALSGGSFEVIVAGHRKGTGSSRETAVQAEKFSGIRISVAASFAPIHARNLTNQGVLMADHEQLVRLQAGEELPLAEFTRGMDPLTAEVVASGGLFAFSERLRTGKVSPPQIRRDPAPMNMAEKILSEHLIGAPKGTTLRPGDAVVVQVDGGYSHEFTTAQVHAFLTEEFGQDYPVAHPKGFAVFEDHLIHAGGVERMAPFLAKIEELREMQRQLQRHTGVRDFSAREGVSPGICHQVAREEMILPGQLYQATDSHTCMGGASNALAHGVGATEYAALLRTGFTAVRVPETIRFELVGEFADGVTAKDLILHVLRCFAVEEATLDRVMEWGGPGLASLSIDERATLANMATECSAKTGLFEGDERLVEWIRSRRHHLDPGELRESLVRPDPGARYAGGVHTLDLSSIEPMVARPGDPTYGQEIASLGEVTVDIAYGGSCTAGKEDDVDAYARVVREALVAGRRLPGEVEFWIQFASDRVERHARAAGHLEAFEAAGVRLIPPGCGACIGCGPGVSTDTEQVTISAINRNFANRSGPGRLYLASPLTVAASAFEGRITAYRRGMFAGSPG